VFAITVLNVSVVLIAVCCMAKLSSMFFCIVTDYYPRGSLEAYLDVMHVRRQIVPESVSAAVQLAVTNSIIHDNNSDDFLQCACVCVCLCVCVRALHYRSLCLFIVHPHIHSLSLA